MASGIACEAQQYLDRGIKSDNTTSHDTAYYTHKSAIELRKRANQAETTPTNKYTTAAHATDGLHHVTQTQPLSGIQTATITQNPPYTRTTPGTALASTDAIAHNASRLSIRLISQRCGGARGVMVIVVGNGHGDTSSNPGRD